MPHDCWRTYEKSSTAVLSSAGKCAENRVRTQFYGGDTKAVKYIPLMTFLSELAAPHRNGRGPGEIREEKAKGSKWHQWRIVEVLNVDLSVTEDGWKDGEV